MKWMIFWSVSFNSSETIRTKCLLFHYLLFPLPFSLTHAIDRRCAREWQCFRSLSACTGTTTTNHCSSSHWFVLHESKDNRSSRSVSTETTWSSSETWLLRRQLRAWMSIINCSWNECSFILVAFTQNQKGEIKLSSCPECRSNSPFELNLKEVRYCQWQKRTTSDRLNTSVVRCYQRTPPWKRIEASFHRIVYSGESNSFARRFV